MGTVLHSTEIVVLLFFQLNDLIHSISNAFFEDVDFEEKYLIVVLTRLGLANRLRTLSDWYNIALIQNRTMLVNWVPTLDCNAYFTDLFEVGSLPRFKSSSKVTILTTWFFEANNLFLVSASTPIHGDSLGVSFISKSTSFTIWKKHFPFEHWQCQQLNFFAFSINFRIVRFIPNTSHNLWWSNNNFIDPMH